MLTSDTGVIKKPPVRHTDDRRYHSPISPLGARSQRKAPLSPIPSKTVTKYREQTWLWNCSVCGRR